jgi:hypothetical protein
MGWMRACSASFNMVEILVTNWVYILSMLQGRNPWVGLGQMLVQVQYK